MAGQKKQSKTTKVESAPAPAPTPVKEVTTNEVVEEMSPYQLLTTQFESFASDFKRIMDDLGSLRTRYRLLERDTGKLIKASQKKHDRKKVKTGERKPSGFTKPSVISLELATFLGKPTGTLMARTEVTKEINTYIKANNLQGKENGRIINADNKLSKLLKLKKEDKLTYFNLQKYMSCHFPKQTPTTSATK